MEIPSEVGVMTLPSVTLFPQALLPLYIYEQRYRRMLKDALETHRLFVVAMQKPERVRETPSHVAGLGMIRVSVDNDDCTSHLILQGITRVELGERVPNKRYRVHRICPLQAPHTENVAVDALVAKVRDLVVERVQLGVDAKKSHKKQKPPSLLTIKDVMNYLKELEDADQVADLVSCALLPSPVERQTILETIEVEPRLKQLIHFLMAEIKHYQKNKGHG
jgi:Lon protease-like protein